MRMSLSDGSKGAGMSGNLEKARREAETLEDYIMILREEAALLEDKGDALSSADRTRLSMIRQTISWMVTLRDRPEPEKGEGKAPRLITYKVVSDRGDRLRDGARIACSFWNRFIQPERPVVIRLGLLPRSDGLIAMAYKPFRQYNTVYGVVEFNSRFLRKYSPGEIAGTIVHEIGHILGIGWEKWEELFFHDTGRFKPWAVKLLEGLAPMEVERGGGPETVLSHWDERKFDRELMTGYKDRGEHVLPVTIDVMELLGHRVTERLDTRRSLDELLSEAARSVFTRQEEVRKLDLAYFEETEPIETIPHSWKRRETC